MVICSIDAFKKSSKKKETAIEIEIQQASIHRKKIGKYMIGIM